MNNIYRQKIKHTHKHRCRQNFGNINWGLENTETYKEKYIPKQRYTQKIYTYTHPNKYTNTQAYTHTQNYIHKHTNKYVLDIDTYPHTNINKYTHTCMYTCNYK